MLCPPHTPAPVVEDWLERHRHVGSFLLHMIGIPPTLVGVLLVPVCIALVSVPIFLFSLALFFGGYAIQFLGHALEGSEPGEITHLRRLVSGPGKSLGAANRDGRGVARDA
jgi:uncharacterized membrane protein YGL010W